MIERRGAGLLRKTGTAIFYDITTFLLLLQIYAFVMERNLLIGYTNGLFRAGQTSRSYGIFH